MRLSTSAVIVSVAGISFTHDSNGQSVRCRIEREALVGREGAHPASNSELRGLFDKYEHVISQAVAQKIVDNDLESDGTVCVKDVDLKRQR